MMVETVFHNPEKEDNDYLNAADSRKFLSVPEEGKPSHIIQIVFKVWNLSQGSPSSAWGAQDSLSCTDRSVCSGLRTKITNFLRT